MPPEQNHALFTGVLSNSPLTSRNSGAGSGTLNSKSSNENPALEVPLPFRDNRPMGLELPEDLAITYMTGQASQLTPDYGQKSVAGIISTFLA